jgi:pimeloyl-ACP methyl ester carboxylesterase
MYGRAALGGKQWLADHLLRAIRRTDGKARYWMVRNSLSGIGADEAALVQTSPKPLAIVQGRSDPFVRADYLESLTYRNLWRGAVQYVDAGHAPHWQRPQKFNKLLLEFLNDARQGK